MKTLALASLAVVCSAADPGLLLLTQADAAKVKKAARSGHPAAAQIRNSADRALDQGPWSVTFHRPKNVAVGPHDFYSDGPYWWPDPKNPSGPYIRRDGETNPDRFLDNDRDQNAMCDAAMALGTAAWLFEDPRYNRRLVHILSVWFLDQKTRMAPHMAHGQAIRGRDDGRNAGLIETRPYIWLIQGMLLAERAPGWNPETGRGMRRWFSEYLSWFTTDGKGLKEMKAGNNHSTWWAAQVASFAILTSDKRNQDSIWDLYRNYLVPGQFQPDGRAPREEERTRSLSYSAMNLDAFALLCRMAEVAGLDLWHFRAPNGAAIETAVAYLAPFATGTLPWSKPQITKYDASRNYFLALAGMGLKKRDLIDAQRRTGLSGGAHADFISLLIDGK